tara:strand:- start:3655 stop:4113 length:459 start_codon:yes stop_codon:yes gene_type:complete
MAITYKNVFWDFVLDPLRDLCMSEYNYGKVYIAPEIQHKDSFSIRLWGLNADKEEYVVDAHARQYNVEVALYMIETNPGEAFYKQFYNDGERLHQLLFNNKTKSTTVDSTTYTWVDGSVESMGINELVGQEETIEGLHAIKIDFNCKLTVSV